MALRWMVKGISSLCRVGSPPVMTTASRRPLRFSRNARISDSGMRSANLSGSTSSGLWQKGQRKLQPWVNTTALILPG